MADCKFLQLWRLCIGATISASKQTAEVDTNTNRTLQAAFARTFAVAGMALVTTGAPFADLCDKQTVR